MKFYYSSHFPIQNALQVPAPPLPHHFSKQHHVLFAGFLRFGIPSTRIIPTSSIPSCHLVKVPRKPLENASIFSSHRVDDSTSHARDLVQRHACLPRDLRTKPSGSPRQQGNAAHPHNSSTSRRASWVSIPPSMPWGKEIRLLTRVRVQSVRIREHALHVPEPPSLLHRRHLGFQLKPKHLRKIIR